MAAAEGAADALAAAAAASLSRWWLSSAFQRTWLRLAVQAGVTVLVLMSIFSPPAVWDLHSFDVVLANPTIILVLTNLGILFSTGIPILKIAFEGLVGALAGGATVLAVTYAAHGISGGAPGVLKAAMTMLLGCPPLLLATATRYRWPQHVGLAGIFFNLTVTVGLAVCYLQSTDLYRFVLYWWWFVGLGALCMAAVGTFVLPLPAGWAVRKQLARALRQEGRVLEAIVQLATCEDPTAGLGGAGRGLARGASSLSFKGDSASGVRGGVVYPDFMTLEEGADSWQAAVLPSSGGDDRESSLVGAALASLWRRGSRRLGRLSRSLRRSRGDVREEAAAMGIHPGMLAAVEPIYSMSGPTAASLSAARAHMRFTWWEVDWYRPTKRFPSLPFARMLLLARTLLSAAMMLLYRLQAGGGRGMGGARQHSTHLRSVAGGIKRCCQGLAAVLRDNAPVAPAIEELRLLEEAVLELQRAVGGAAAAPTEQQPGSAGTAADADAAAAAQQEGGGTQEGAAAAAAGADAAEAAEPAAPAAAGVEEQQQPEDASGSSSLVLHLALSMLFTCCTRVRSMFLLLPQLVGRDQEGVDAAVAAHFATASAWDAAVRQRTSKAPVGGSPRGAADVFRRSQLLWGGGGGGGGSAARLRSSRSSAALDRLEKPAVEVAERRSVGGDAPPPPPSSLARAAGGVQAAFGAAEALTGFCRNQLALGLQMGVSFVAVMFLVVVPSVNAALGGRAVWAVFIIAVVHEPLLGSVIWKSVLRFGGTLVAGALGLGALYFSFLCNGLSFENAPPKFIAMTAALTLLTMPLAAGCARYGAANAYFWVVSCLLMYTVALPNYAHDAPLPLLALWRLACTAIGLAIELLAALTVFPVTAREAAHAAAAGALASMATVAAEAFRSVLQGGAAAAAAAQTQQAQQAQQQEAAQQAAPRHHAVALSAGGTEVASGAVMSRIHAPMMEAYNRVGAFRALLVPLRVEWHPFKQPSRFPTRPGRHAQRLCRRTLNVLTTFAVTMDAHHTESVPLLEPHAGELQGLISQLSETLRALGAMVGGAVSLESAARTVAALERHAQLLMLRVLLSEPPEQLSSVDATQGLAFLAMLFNVTSVARLLCLSLGESFCAADGQGQAAAARLLRDASSWAAEEQLRALAAELVSEALETTEEEAALPAAQ